MRHDFGLSSGLGALHHRPFSADFTINMRGFEFSVHTTAYAWWSPPTGWSNLICGRDSQAAHLTPVLPSVLLLLKATNITPSARLHVMTVSFFHTGRPTNGACCPTNGACCRTHLIYDDVAAEACRCGKTPLCWFCRLLFVRIFSRNRQRRCYC
jgi:hypothetical protein